MTIAELEARSGMTRANIRFYESEGFLSPARRENGYRDYSEADLELLLRLKLLRALDLPLSEILRLQRGELGLAAAMERHAGRLALERRGLSSSEAVTITTAVTPMMTALFRKTLFSSLRLSAP